MPGAYHLDVEQCFGNFESGRAAAMIEIPSATLLDDAAELKGKVVLITGVLNVLGSADTRRWLGFRQWHSRPRGEAWVGRTAAQLIKVPW